MWVKKREGVIIFLVILIFIISLYFSINKSLESSESLLINDVSRLNSIFVKEIVKSDGVDGIQEALSRAREENLKVSISGKRHSQGGQTFYDDTVVLDMTYFNEIIDLDEEQKVITVKSGATWEDIQEYINPLNLSIKVMQSSNIFTVGGSLSSNIHGRDPNYGPIIETVKSFRLLLYNGTIVNVSRSENVELFRSVIGGYGLFGVILDIDLDLTGNVLYKKETELLDYTEYTNLFREKIKNNPEIGLHYARLSIVPDDSFLRETYSVSYILTNESLDKFSSLKEEENVNRDKFLFGLSRKYDWGKRLRWSLQKKLEDNPDKTELISRNNAMRPSIEFLEYQSSRDTDILQEYFIPIDNFVPFIDGTRDIMEKEDINLLSMTIRYIPKNEEAYLSYAKEESFAIVMNMNQGLSKEERENAEHWTQEFVDLAITNNGTYYLTYQLYPSQGQIRKVYPEIGSFFSLKKEYDPNELFMNKFYEKYALGIEDENK